ncbi:MAG: alpha-glucan family phosphorylase [Gammaproteobacteria bacterium]|nr:alpha-glucan family phosphorylase [Gammaproteobacteria bacterium]
MSETTFCIEVQPVIPEKLSAITTLANDLLYSWDRSVRGLFYRLDIELWEVCQHNPKVFLRRIAQQKLDDAAADPLFMEEFNRVISFYRSYHEMGQHPKTVDHIDEGDTIAYFCAEFGFHESLPIYSGGLGILAGDHCKSASDLGLPFVAIGLLYRQGYFTQTIDANGQQQAHYHSVNFSDLLVTPALDSNGEELKVGVELAGRRVTARVWQAKAGHIMLYLLDTDLDENSPHDRSITFQLYGGDVRTRIQQELVLGIGGVRALRALGINPSVWHINEGHSAFQIIERCREHVANGLDFDSALELVASGTVFTTHTPVPAGHDIFEQELLREHLGDYLTTLNITLERLLELGSTPGSHTTLNMTAMALRGSRFHNGVSRVHGEVAAKMESYIWPQIPTEENPISHVTNGVHVPTFLAREWVNLFDMRFREWRNELINPGYWSCIDTIPEHRFWSLRQELKAQMLDDVHQRTRERFLREEYSDALINAITQNLCKPEENVLVIGFARRFATYKRATLLFADIKRLERILGNPQQPVVLIFAGKAHPHDIPGQELIKTIHELSLQPAFIGKIILLEGYDMAMARKLVTGVDVWLNTPEYPLEASGTSGQKAAINGVINLSVLDGWWDEGFDGSNGWAIHPHLRKNGHTKLDITESNDLLELLEHKVLPLYFDCGSRGYSKQWVELSKASMKSCIPRFNGQRMVVDYLHDYYAKAITHHKKLTAENGAPARELAQWKSRVRQAWRGVTVSRVDKVIPAMAAGKSLPISVSVNLNGLEPADVVVECLVGSEPVNGHFSASSRHCFSHLRQEDGRDLFELQLQPTLPGVNFYKIRLYPYHTLLCHPFETGSMVWL